MSAENDSHSHNFQTNIPNNISANKVESNIQILNNSASNSQAKKSEMSQEVIDQEDKDKFNISFFLPKELSKKIEGDDENLDNKNNIFDSNHQLTNNFNQNSESELTKNNNNRKDLELNQKKNSLNKANKFDNNNKIINHKYISEVKFNNLNKKEDVFPGNNYFSTNTNTNPFFIPNNNNIINYQFNNNFFLNNVYFSNNTPYPINIPQMSNNFSLYNNINNLHDINSNYMMNYNEYNNFVQTNKFQSNNNQESKNNKKQKQMKKKVIDEYTLEMFGRRGWICNLCNNFNYDTRQKCNRCHIFKNPKKIEDYLQFEKNKSKNHKHDWLCKNCGNYNYAFRLICNRCQSKKEDI